MNLELNLAKDFGTFLAEGALAVTYRLQRIEPFFANALIVPIVEQDGEAALGKLRFRGCNAIVRVMIESALALGVERGARPTKRELA